MPVPSAPSATIARDRLRGRRLAGSWASANGATSSGPTRELPDA